MLSLYIYWISTSFLCGLYIISAALYIFKKKWVLQALSDLRFPAPWLLPFIVVIKIAAPVVILSRINVGLSDLAYAGLLYHLILSALAHLGVKKYTNAVPAAVGLMLLVLSCGTQNAARENPSPYGQFVHASFFNH